MPEAAIKVLFAQLVGYQEFMMNEGIMHRDLKPQNILYDKDTGRAKVSSTQRRGDET